MLGFNEEQDLEEQGTEDKAVKTATSSKEEIKPLKMSGTKKFQKLIKNPISIGGTVYKDEFFEIDITALKKMNKNLTVQIERSIELEMIKAV